MYKRIEKAIVCLSAPIFLLCLGTGIGFSQTKSVEEGSPDIKLGEIRFQVKELASTPSPLKMLEVHVEVLNRSRQTAAAANSIKLVLVPTETKYPEGTSGKSFDPGQQETTIGSPLPPASARIVIFGFSLPEKIPESITFEVQLDSPEGEKKTATWESNKT